jgi:membrane protein YqaA with SNARE-associated domain
MLKKTASQYTPLSFIHNSVWCVWSVRLLTYLTLFIASLLAATLLPGGSEALLLYDLSLGYNPTLLIIFATFGNTLGSIIIPNQIITNYLKNL